MNGKLGAVDAAVNDRLKLSARGEEIVKVAQTTQTKLNDVLLPAGEKAQADITMVSMTLGGDANQTMMTLLKLVSTQVPVSQGFADLVGYVNLASSLLDRARTMCDYSVGNGAANWGTSAAIGQIEAAAHVFVGRGLRPHRASATSASSTAATSRGTRPTSGAWTSTSGRCATHNDQCTLGHQLALLDLRPERDPGARQGRSAPPPSGT